MSANPAKPMRRLSYAQRTVEDADEARTVDLTHYGRKSGKEYTVDRTVSEDIVTDAEVLDPANFVSRSVLDGPEGPDTVEPLGPCGRRTRR